MAVGKRFEGWLLKVSINEKDIYKASFIFDDEIYILQRLSTGSSSSQIVFT